MMNPLRPVPVIAALAIVASVLSPAVAYAQQAPTRNGLTATIVGTKRVGYSRRFTENVSKSMWVRRSL